jgi:hypothetical protein
MGARGTSEAVERAERDLACREGPAHLVERGLEGRPAHTVAPPLFRGRRRRVVVRADGVRVGHDELLDARVEPVTTVAAASRVLAAHAAAIDAVPAAQAAAEAVEARAVPVVVVEAAMDLQASSRPGIVFRPQPVGQGTARQRLQGAHKGIV